MEHFEIFCCRHMLCLSAFSVDRRYMVMICVLIISLARHSLLIVDRMEIYKTENTNEIINRTSYYLLPSTYGVENKIKTFQNTTNQSTEDAERRNAYLSR